MKLRNRRCDGLGRERQRRAPPRRASHYAPLFLFALGVLVVGPMAPARAQGNMGPLIDRMERMEREMITLQRNLYRGDQQPPPADAGGGAVVIPQPAVGGMQVRMWELEQEIRGLTGQVEQIGFQVRQMNDRLDKLVADMDFRMQALEQQAGGQPAQAAIAPITPPAAGISPFRGRRNWQRLTGSRRRCGPWDKSGSRMSRPCAPAHRHQGRPLRRCRARRRSPRSRLGRTCPRARRSRSMIMPTAC